LKKTKHINFKIEANIWQTLQVVGRRFVISLIGKAPENESEVLRVAISIGLTEMERRLREQDGK